jgi:hypothetical protein
VFHRLANTLDWVNNVVERSKGDRDENDVSVLPVP